MSEREPITTADIAAPQQQPDDAATDAPADTAIARDDANRTGGAGSASAGAAALGPLLGGDDMTEFRSRWQEVQTGFVDEPRESVQRADALVAELMQRLATTFRDERESLESHWSRGDDVSTEDLRVALQRYRSFFERLLST